MEHTEISASNGKYDLAVAAAALTFAETCRSL
jgi:hypothetical protein